MTSGNKTSSTKSHTLQRTHPKPKWSKPIRSCVTPTPTTRPHLRPVHLSQLQVLPVGLRQESHQSCHVATLPLQLPSCHLEEEWRHFRRSLKKRSQGFCFGTPEKPLGSRHTLPLRMIGLFLVQFWPLSLSRNAPLSQREGPGTIVCACLR